MKRASYVFLSLVIITSLILGVGCEPTVSQSGPRELYVLTFGGAYEDVLQANAVEFEREHNAKVIFVQGQGMDALVKARNKEIDVVITDPTWAYRGEDEGIWEKLDEESVPNLNKLYNTAKLSECIVTHDAFSNIIAYNPKFVKEKPTSWLDLWKPEYKDKVTLRSFGGSIIDLLFLMARLHGGDENNLDPGFEKMAELARNNVHTWFKDHPQCLNLFRNEEVWLAHWTDGRVDWAKREGVNVEMAIPKEGVFASETTMSVVAGRPNTDLALAYINYELSEGPQLAIAEAFGYFPMNKEVKLPPEVQAKSGFTPESIEKIDRKQRKMQIDMMDELYQRWEKEILGAR